MWYFYRGFIVTYVHLKPMFWRLEPFEVQVGIGFVTNAMSRGPRPTKSMWDDIQAFFQVSRKHRWAINPY